MANTSASVEQQRIHGWIDSHVDHVVGFLQRLVRTPSVTGEEKSAQELVAGHLRGLGLRVDVWEPDLAELRKHPDSIPVETGYANRPNVVGVWEGEGGGRSILFNGHVDVVPPGPERLWSHDPWSGTIEGARIYGRGTSDMKGGLAAMLCAVEAVKAAGARLRGHVIVESVVDEEAGGNGTLAAVLRGYTADAIIVPEPTRLGVSPAHRGAQFFRVRVWGKGAHAGLRFEGVSALEKAQRLIGAIGELEAERNRSARENKLYNSYPIAAPITIGKMTGGVWPAMVPEMCEFEGMIDIMPGERISDVREQFSHCIEQAATADPWLQEHRPEVEWIGVSMSGIQTDIDHPFAYLIRNVCAQVTGRDPVVVGFPAGSDLRLLVGSRGTPGVHLGPGDIRLAHGFDEYVRVDEVLAAAKIFASTILNWCGVVE